MAMVTSTGRRVVGGGAVVVLVATGAWAARPAGVDTGLWSRVRPAIEARLVADAETTGLLGDKARWFCRAEPLELEEHADVVRAGVTTLCVEYGTRAGALVECGGAAYPQVLRLEREPSGTYRVLSREEPPDGADQATWLSARVGPATDRTLPAATLETGARAYFGLPESAPVTEC